MTEDNKLELVSAAMDGELDADERRELDALLESSAEARELKAELDQLDSMLKGVPELEPPASLHDRIMADAHPPRAASKASALDWLRQLTPGAGLRYAIAASVGAIVAAAVITFPAPQSVPMDVSDLVGAMAPGSDSSELASFDYVEDGIDCTVQLRRSDGKLLLDIQAETSEPVDIAVSLGGAGLWPQAMAQFEGQHRSIAFSGQDFEFQVHGRQRTSILLRRVDGPMSHGKADITIKYSVGDRLLRQGVLEATW